MTLHGRGEESGAMIRERQEDVTGPVGRLRAGVRWSSMRAKRRLGLARHLQACGQLSAAARQFERAVALLDALPPGGDRDRRRADVHIGLAEVHRRGGRYAAATAALTAARDLVGRHDPAIVMLLAVIAKDQGRLGEAAMRLGRLERARLTASEAAALEHHLADLANAQYRFVAAEEHARRALRLRRSDPRSTAVDVAQDVAVLAAAVAGQHRYDEARFLFGRALAACRAAQPARRYEIAGHLHNLAGIEHDCGRLAVAEVLYREALAIKRSLLGPAHPEVALLLTTLAILLRDLGCKDEAADHFRQALDITEPAVVAS
jgi:tetratricopeptide (TPR) repeat protein